MKFLFFLYILFIFSLGLGLDANPIDLSPADQIDIEIVVRVKEGKNGYSFGGREISPDKLPKLFDLQRSRSGKQAPYNYGIFIGELVSAPELFEVIKIFESYGDGRIFVIEVTSKKWFEVVSNRTKESARTDPINTNIYKLSDINVAGLLGENIRLQGYLCIDGDNRIFLFDNIANFRNADYRQAVEIELQHDLNTDANKGDLVYVEGYLTAYVETIPEVAAIIKATKILKAVSAD